MGRPELSGWKRLKKVSQSPRYSFSGVKATEAAEVAEAAEAVEAVEAAEEV